MWTKFLSILKQLERIINMGIPELEQAIAALNASIAAATARVNAIAIAPDTTAQVTEIQNATTAVDQIAPPKV